MNSQLLPVAVDAMGGDNAPEATVEGAVCAARDGVPVVLVGKKAELKKRIPRGVSVDLVDAKHVVEMGESAALAVRNKPDSSLIRTLAMVRNGEACAAVSCGNTGGVLVGSVRTLGMFDGVKRPAIATVLPRSDGGKLVLLDGGANVDCAPELLVRFAHLGAAYADSMGISEPRVGLLSNGEEEHKGNSQVRQTLPLLRETDLNVVGNVEPHAAMAGSCDVLVCDGFVGNILIKGVEAAAETVIHILKEEVKKNPSTRLGAWLTAKLFGRLRSQISWQSMGGGLLLGTKGVVIVGHGRANAEAVTAAIHMAHDASRHRLVERIGSSF